MSLPLPSSGFSVLQFVVFPKLARLDRLPPVRVVAVPVDRFLDGLVEGTLRRPAHHLADLGRVDRMAAYMAGPVGNFLDQGVRLAERVEDQVGDVEYGFFNARA